MVSFWRRKLLFGGLIAELGWLEGEVDQVCKHSIGWDLVELLKLRLVGFEGGCR